MSLVTDEIRGWIGREVTYTAPEPISAAAFRYFGQAIGDDNPLYTDPGFAREHGYEDVVAPPTLICETNQYANLPKNSHGFAGHLWDLKIEGCRLVRGGNSYRFHRPVYPSDIV